MHPGRLTQPPLFQEPRLAVRTNCTGIVREHVEPDPIHVQVGERVIDERSDGVLSVALSPVVAPDLDADLATSVEMIDRVKAALPDQFAVDHDREVERVPFAFLISCLVPRLELGAREGADRSLRRQDRDFMIRDELPQPRQVRRLDRSQEDAFARKHSPSLRPSEPTPASLGSGESGPFWPEATPTDLAVGAFRGCVRPLVYDRVVGSLIDLSQWRERRERDPMTRLERAIARLEGLLRLGSGRLGSRVESELLAITGAVTAGLEDEAAERAERLAERLEHPSARLSS
jgi:hypothetical protein